MNARENLYVAEYPASWFAVAPSRALKRQGKRPVDAFGKRLVVWRDAAGRAHVQQRFCPHMGASLARGEVEGERIVCPFHRWEYGADGKCAKIPYVADVKIPRRARLETFPVVEHTGWIWAFNGETPTHALPPLPEYGAKDFVMREKTQIFEVHPLLMLENGCDAQHFKYVHKVKFESYDVDMTRDEEHGFAFDVNQMLRLPGGKMLKLTTSISYMGASLIYGRLARDGKVFSTFIAAPTPTAPNVTQFTLIVAVKRLPLPLRPFDHLYASFFARQMYNGATDDYFPVWKDMDPSFRGALVADDGLQQRFRRYYHAHLPPHQGDEPLGVADLSLSPRPSIDVPGARA